MATALEQDDEAAASPTTIVHDTLATADELNSWLTAHGVDTASWGVGKAKTISHLLDEVVSKESTLQLLAGQVFRCLTVVKMVICHPTGAPRHLVHARQKMADGRVRERNVLPSEKMVAGEEAKHAAVRGVLEEMGEYVLAQQLIKVDPETLLVWNEIVDSPSYPSLTTQYTLYQVGVRLRTACIPHA